MREMLMDDKEQEFFKEICSLYMFMKTVKQGNLLSH